MNEQTCSRCGLTSPKLYIGNKHRLVCVQCKIAQDKYTKRKRAKASLKFKTEDKPNE